MKAVIIPRLEGSERNKKTIAQLNMMIGLSSELVYAVEYSVRYQPLDAPCVQELIKNISRRMFSFEMPSEFYPTPEPAFAHLCRDYLRGYRDGVEFRSSEIRVFGS